MHHFLPSKLLARGCCFGAVGLLAGLLPVAAHGPFDHSAQLLVGASGMEFVVTMGADATRAFLTAAGLSVDKSTEVVSRTAGQPPLELPKALGPRLVEISVADRVLEGGEVHATTDGMETRFTVVFPAAVGAVLDVRAHYFNGIEAMKQGAFLAVDENQQQLGAALWSRANDSVRIALPGKATGKPAGEPVVTTDRATIVAAADRQFERSSVTNLVSTQRNTLQPRAKRGLTGIGVVLVVLLVALSRRFRRRISP